MKHHSGRFASASRSASCRHLTGKKERLIGAETEKAIRAALNKPGRTEGVRKIAARVRVRFSGSAALSSLSAQTSPWHENAKTPGCDAGGQFNMLEADAVSSAQLLLVKDDALGGAQSTAAKHAYRARRWLARNCTFAFERSRSGQYQGGHRACGDRVNRDFTPLESRRKSR